MPAVKLYVVEGRALGLRMVTSFHEEWGLYPLD